MKYLAAVHTDVGTRRKKNQDSMIVMEAQTGTGNILFAAVCDGMGGLDRGEAASAAMIHAFADWFEARLIYIARAVRDGTFQKETLREEWSSLIENTSRCIEDYGRERHICLGTTAVGILICGDRYYTLNVGDSRAYLLTDRIYLLTKDQTYVQQELDAGRMTYEQSLTHPKRNLLLQCVGAGADVRPAYGQGRAAAEQLFLLCSDGFRHVVGEDELYRTFAPSKMNGEEIMKKSLSAMTRRIKERGETDNISAMLIRLE